MMDERTDLTELAKKVEQLISEEVDGKAAFILAFTYPPDHNVARYVANVTRPEGARLFSVTLSELSKKLDREGGLQ